MRAQTKQQAHQEAVRITCHSPPVVLMRMRNRIPRQDAVRIRSHSHPVVLTSPRGLRPTQATRGTFVLRAAPHAGHTHCVANRD